MVIRHGWRSPWIVTAAALLSVGCEKPVVKGADQAALVGGVEFELGAYDVRFLELSEGGQTYEYPTPVLAIPLTITNKGKDPLPYTPTHRAPQMGEASTPLLYADPGPEAQVPPEKKSPINGVIVQKGVVTGQLNQAITIAPGESAQDLLLFEQPPEGISSLILSLPPTMHRGKVPALFRIAYAPKAPTGPRLYKAGEAADLGGVSVTVTGTDTLYVPTQDTKDGEGFSADPLFQVKFTLKNDRAETITYQPNHKAVGSNAIGARLYASDDVYKRVQFAPSTSPKGQAREERVDVAPGETFDDFVLFEVPSESATTLMLEVPGALFEGVGNARVQLTHTPKQPPKPEALQPKQATPADK